MTKHLFITALLFFLLMGCSDKASLKAQDSPVQTTAPVRYKLFPTENMWNFIKLDTRTGEIWQVQYSINKPEGRFECTLNSFPLVYGEEQVDGRFELYPTENMYNFILLDRIVGTTWQVQWSFERENRGILRISD